MCRTALEAECLVFLIGAFLSGRVWALTWSGKFTSALAFATKTEHENEQRVSSSCSSNSASSGLGIGRKQWKFSCLEYVACYE